MMSDSNLFVKRKLKFKVTNYFKHKYPVAPNILKHSFRVDRKIKMGMRYHLY